MISWSIAIVVTAIACAALFYAAAGRTVNAAGPVSVDANNHFRALLAGIEADLASGKLDETQALAAKGELAREMLRAEADSSPVKQADLGRGAVAAGLAAVAVLALGLYAFLGSPDQPSQPLAERPEVVAQSTDLDEAIAQIEARLAQTPDDVRGWSVIAPAYMELGRYGDAVKAYRRVIALSGPTAELQTDLAEALFLQADGAESGEAMELLRAAIASDPQQVRARLYLASELMQLRDYAQAADYWQQALDLAKGDEPWIPAARQGLAVAQNDGVDESEAQQAQMIQQMVSGLADRLGTHGGTVEEWIQLVRAYIVLEEMDKAQSAYDAAVAAYPAAFDRGELDSLALGAGLQLNGANR